VFSHIDRSGRERLPQEGLRQARIARGLGLLIAAAVVLAAPQPALSQREAAPQAADGAAPPEGGAIPDGEQERPKVRMGAEGLLRLQRRAEGDRKRLRQVEQQLAEAERRFASASKRFEELDARLTELRSAESSPDALPRGLAAADLPARIAEVEQSRAEARDALDLEIRRREALAKQAKILERQTAFEDEVLALSGGAEPSRATERGRPAAATAARPGPAAAPDAPPTEAAGAADGTAAPAPQTAATDRRVADALRDLEQRQETLDRLVGVATLMDRASGLNEEDLAATQTLLELARERQQRAEGDPQAQGVAAEVTQEIEQLESRSQLLSETLEDLRQQRAEVDARIAEASEKVASAQRWAEFVQSPWAPHRIARRALWAAPRIAVVLVVLGGLWLLAHLLARRAASTYVERGRRGTRAERTDRAATLQRAAGSLLNTFFLGLGSLMLLDQLGVDVTVLLGGAAVFGVALAFGAQNLLQDYYSGLMILLENQYRVGNVVKIGDISGVVEDITLRMTMLRDLEGVAHFIPHGQVKTVSNLTHYWSRALLDVPVAYKEDVEKVIEVLLAVAHEMRSDPEVGSMILEEAEMLGVEQFADSAVVVRMTIKTVPIKQWSVKRAMLRRIKQRFDELGIEIPFPHRTVYHRGLGGEGDAHDDALPGSRLAT